MIIKVCGLKDNQNIQDIIGLDIDWIGYNFYKPSSRYISSIPFINKKNHQKIIGVFVNASESTILQKVKNYNLDYIQLHGDESPEFCKNIKESIPLIKVFRVDNLFDFKLTKEYEFCDYFLFDTASTQYGGSGQKFDWSILDELEISVPFLLSGGIGPDDHGDILKIEHPKFIGIDINSKFEVSPGLKDISLLNGFLKQLKNDQNYLSINQQR
ncbi:MAG: phosphoribosylanthranilate isomerase [Saprospiraceae bacterium]|nr:phosphoribosylanthranilate isomerase [Saprospiraceae bacterium]